MRKMILCYVTVSVIATLLMFCISGAAPASVIWDGSGDPELSGFSLNSVIPLEPDGVDPDPFKFDWCNNQACTGMMYQNTTPWTTSGESGAYYTLPTADTELIRANGWSVETRVHVTGNTGDLFGTFLSVADEQGGIGLLLRPREIQVYESSWATYAIPVASIPITWDYHDIRIEVAAGGTSGDVFVDNMVTPAASITLPSDPGARLSFGDASSGSAGIAHWDHVVVNAVAPAATTPPPLGSGLNIDATFDAGTLPTDFGMITSGDINPIPNVSGGKWTNNRLAGEMSTWKSSELPGDISGPIFHGFAEVEQATLGGSIDDQTLMALGTDYMGAISFVLGMADGAMSGYGSSSVTPFSVAVENTDGDKHKYGWEADVSSGVIKLFFDDAQVGEGEGYNIIGNFFGEDLMYFGDASGGNDHSEVWDRWLFAEGVYPTASYTGGDFNKDGAVNVTDLGILATNYGITTGMNWEDGDATGDGAVDVSDLGILATNYGSSSMTAVPEPVTLALLAFGTVFVVASRWHRRS